MRKAMALCAILVGALNTSSSFGQNNFSCPYGTDGACLDYGARICSSLAKCVDSNAICFNKSTCDYAGFACKSEVNKGLNQYEELRRKYNTLIDDHNSLVADHKSLMNDARSLQDSYSNATQELEHALGKQKQIDECIAGADSLESAQMCSRL